MLLMNVQIHKYRRLLVLAVNELLKKGCISLDYINDERDEKEFGHLQTKLVGFESIILWRNIGYGELKVSVWWNYNHSKHPQAEMEGDMYEKFDHESPLAKKTSYQNFVGAVISGTLERKTGKYLMGKNSDGISRIYLRKDMGDILNNLVSPTATGYSPEGKFHF